MDTRPQTTTWCEGLPRTAIRPLADDERIAIRRLAARALWQFALGLAIVPAMILALMASISIAGPLSKLTGITGFLTALSPVAAILIARDAWRRRAALLTDLRSGEIWVFERLDGQPGAPFGRLDTLPASQIAWLVDGHRPRKWTPAETTDVANTPEYASTAAEWVEPSDPADASSPRFNHREMAPAERDEIQRHVRRLRWSSTPVVVLMNVYAALRLAGAFFTHTLPAPWFVVWFAGTALVDVNLYRRCKIAARMTSDLNAGRIVIARVPVKDGQPGELSDPVEILPRSRTVWTQSGRPAGWRVARTTQTRNR
jgi:hypothetical protein